MWLELVTSGVLDGRKTVVKLIYLAALESLRISDKDLETSEEDTDSCSNMDAYKYVDLSTYSVYSLDDVLKLKQLIISYLNPYITLCLKRMLMFISDKSLGHYFSSINYSITIYDIMTVDTILEFLRATYSNQC